VLSPDDVPENGQLVGTTDDGTEIIYVDEATAPPVVIDENDLDGGDGDTVTAVPPPRPRPRARTSQASRSRTPLRDLPTSAELGTAAAPPITAAGAAGAAPDVDDLGGDPALSLYRRGTAALKAREHAAAVAAFRDLVARYPQHDYADNAQYWLGEAFYDQKDYARAITEFRATVSRYPRGNKVPDALLKIGFAYQALGETDKARAALEQVVSLYPGSSPAAIASARLEKP
jgi:tol-pal system protein YbgF